MAKGCVFILSVSSDIGHALALKFLSDGYGVVGTFRDRQSIIDLTGKPGLKLIRCDVSSRGSIGLMIDAYKTFCQPWDTFISCVGTLEPIGPFLSHDFYSWEKSLTVNSIAQLGVLHGIYPYRRQGHVLNVVFFAGGGSNSPFKNYSAYAASKVLLIKMCELLDDEYEDLNPFIIGPGFRKTKIHRQTFNNPVGAEKNLNRTYGLFELDQSDSSFDDIYCFIQWAVMQGKKVVGGRNFSVVHDRWWQDARLVELLKGDKNKFKLRRFRNEEE